MNSQQTTVEQAIASFAAGRPVLIHDSAEREGETDLVYPAESVTPADVARLRNDAGGLVFVALPNEIADAFELPFIENALDHPATGDHELGYDDRSSFSLTVNHRETFTGITDRDRALTITELASAADAAAHGTDDTPEAFAERFRSPGHVHVLRGASGGLTERVGHTELTLALADAADTAPAAVGAEMLDDDTGGALSPEAARSYADAHGIAYVDGARLVNAFLG